MLSTYCTIELHPNPSVGFQLCLAYFWTLYTVLLSVLILYHLNDFIMC